MLNYSYLPKSLIAFLMLHFLFGTYGEMKGQFSSGNILIASSRDARVYEYDPAYNLISSWTHPSFGTPGQLFTFGPNGMAFDAQGNLVVAGFAQLCVFSASNSLIGCFNKVNAEATEYIIFDSQGNLYTTNSTAGTNLVHKYDQNYNYITSFSMPTSELTGITCDTMGNLFIASQACSCIYKVNGNSFAVLDTISGFTGFIDGIQMSHGGDLLVTQHFPNPAVNGQILRINPSSPLVNLQTISIPGIRVPVPITIDNAGNIYTADWENGQGTVAADLATITPSGVLAASAQPSAVRGPMGIVVAGTNLPCGAFQQPVPTLSQWSMIILGLLVLCIGGIVIHQTRFGVVSRPES